MNADRNATIRARAKAGDSLQSIAREYGISRQRAQQIVQKATIDMERARDEEEAEFREVLANQVRWYQQHGRHSDRIARCGSGDEYVIGDWSWSRLYRNRPEYVDIELDRYIPAAARSQDRKKRRKASKGGRGPAAPRERSQEMEEQPDLPDAAPPVQP